MSIESIIDATTKDLKEKQKSFSFFSDSEVKKQEQKSEINTQTKKELQESFTPDSKEIITNTLTKLKNGYETLYNKLPDKTIEEGEHKGKTYKNVLKLKYETLVQEIQSCKNDGELKLKYTSIKNSIDSWINDLEEEGSGIEQLYSKITNLDGTKTKTINGLKDLKVELAIFEGIEKQKALKEELDKTKKTEDTKEEDNIASILKDFGIPAGIAGMIAGFVAMFTGGKEKGEKGFFSGIIGFFKNPIEGTMDYFGYGKEKKDDKVIKNDTDTEIKKEESIEVSTGKIIDITDGQQYTNGDMNIEITNNSISKITIAGISYEIDLSFLPDILLGDMRIESTNNTDILIIGDTEINLTNFIKNNIRKDKTKDSYLLSKNFKMVSDLLIKKI